jgi:probable HAF family extracellular repeat protein
MASYRTRRPSYRRAPTAAGFPARAARRRPTRLALERLEERSVPAFTYFDLGTLGGLTSAAHAINNAGQIVGDSLTADGNLHATLWNVAADGSVTKIDLGTLGGTTSSANAINIHGQVTGYSTLADGTNRAFLWHDDNGNGISDPGEMKSLGTLPGGTDSQADALNDNGFVTGFSHLNSAVFHAFLWNGSTMIDLGAVYPPTSVGFSINNANTVVGYTSTSQTPIHAAISTNGQPFQELPNSTFVGGAGSTATSINDSGVIVGKAKIGSVAGPHHTFLYVNGVMTDLGLIPSDGAGGRSSYPTHVNNAGDIVGTSDYTGGAKHGYLYHAGTMFDLNSLATLPAGWFIDSATWVSDKGQIVGGAMDSSGNEHAFLLRPQAVHLQLTAPAGATAGTPAGVTVTATDLFGNPVPGYTGTVHFTSTDTSAALPADYTFTGADQGSHTFSDVTLFRAGVQSVYAADAGDAVLAAGADVAVTSAAVNGFEVNIPGNVSVGTPLGVTVVARDAFGNAVTDYSGTVHFFCSDPGSVVPADSPLPGGIGTFTFTLTGAGDHNIIVNDTQDVDLVGVSGLMKVTPGPAATFVVDTPVGTRAGKRIGVTVFAMDAFGNLASGYTGTVHFSSNDPAAALPADATLAGGYATFSFTFRTTGGRTLTATDDANPALTGTSDPVNINPGAVTGFIVSAPASTGAGAPLSITVTAVDAYGNVASGYTGPVKFSSTDGQADVPGDSSLGGGQGTFSVTLKTAGTQAVIVTAVASDIITGSASVAVSPGDAAGFKVSVPTVAKSGTPFLMTVTAVDAFGNTATGYAGTVTFSANDRRGSLPADSTLPGGSNTFTAMLKSPGDRTVFAKDKANGAVAGSGTASVGSTAPTDAVTFLVSVPAGTPAGTPIAVTVTALDASGNPATGYTGTVHFTSTDPLAVLPLDTTLAHGTGTFTAVLRTAGGQTLTATDTAVGTVSGTSSPTAVGPASVTHLQMTTQTSTVAGAPFSVTVTALDAFGNVATNYGGGVRFSSTDGQAVLPDITSLVNGTLTVTVTLKTAGAQTLVASAGKSQAASAKADIAVSPAGVSQFAVTVPDDVSAGVPFAVTVTAQDAYHNTITNYGGTVHFSSSDPGAGLPADSTLPGGSKAFTFTLKTAGTDGLTATDSGNGSLTGSSTVVVDPGAAVAFTVDLPAGAVAGAAADVTVTAFDAYGNPTPNYSGVLRFTASDGQAVLPPDSTLNLGTGTFSAVLKTAGGQTVTVTDTSNAGLTGSGSLTVSPGEVVRFEVTAPASNDAGATSTVTVTALDAYGNVATGYTGTVFFASNDYQVDLPDSSTLTNGFQSFSVVLKTAGIHNVTAVDTVHDGLTGQASVNTIAGPVAKLSLTAPPISPFAGSAFTMPVTARDAYFNFINTYNGTVHFTSSDPNALLPADGPLTNGIGTFSFTLYKALQQTVTATDTANGSITGSVTFPVKPGPVVSYKLTAPPTAVSGVPFSVTAEADDQYGNKNALYTGTAHVTSSDPLFVPFDVTFGTADHGLITFDVTLFTTGVQTVTLTDKANSSIKGTATVTVNNPPVPGPGVGPLEGLRVKRLSLPGAAPAPAPSTVPEGLSWTDLAGPLSTPPGVQGFASQASGSASLSGRTVDQFFAQPGATAPTPKAPTPAPAPSSPKVAARGPAAPSLADSFSVARDGGLADE